MVCTDIASAAYTHLATGVAQLDADLRLTYANPAFIELTGFGWSRLRQQTLAALAPDGARLHAAAVRVCEQGVPESLAVLVVCAAPGRDACLDFCLSPVAGGVLLEAHASAPAWPGARVAESLRGFAHEIRNPLAAIAGAAQLLAQYAVDARQRGLAQLIDEEAARLALLSERLLGRRNTLVTRSVNVHAVLERVAELLQAGNPQIEIARDYDPSLPDWHGDPDRLLQALLNLVRNAAQAHAGRIVLRSRAEAGWRDSDGRKVPALRVEIDDDGDGVPAAIAANLFEPMVSGRADGSGLGLALAREIAREHGGELSWQARARGACFVLRLPRHPRSAEALP